MKKAHMSIEITGKPGTGRRGLFCLMCLEEHVTDEEFATCDERKKKMLEDVRAMPPEELQRMYKEVLDSVVKRYNEPTK